MNESEGYAVFFFPQALEALGEAIKPYLQHGPGGPHVLCAEIDTGGALIEMTLRGTTDVQGPAMLELMVPTSMVRMIVSAHSDEAFGFGPRLVPPLITALPPVAGGASPAGAPSEALPATAGKPAKKAVEKPAEKPTETPAQPSTKP